MNWAQFKDHMCPAGAVVASWSLTEELAGDQVRAHWLYGPIDCNDKYFLSVKTFREKSNLEEFSCSALDNLFFEYVFIYYCTTSFHVPF